MSKKDGLKKNNNEVINEDSEIKKVANSKNENQTFLLILLSVFFIGMLICSFIWVDSFYKERDRSKEEIIEIKNDKNTILIVNNGEINEELTINSFNNEETLVVEKINTLEMSTKNDASNEGSIKYNVRYQIQENSFVKEGVDNTDSSILVKFSYSYDNENWTYINNVISTDTSTILPLMGKNYDIRGIVTTLKIATDEVLACQPGESKKIYWRSETIFRNFKDKEIVKNYRANFKIEYSTNN